jgi:hypothetical protein
MTLSTDTIAQMMQVTLKVNGNVFGAGEPPPVASNQPYTTGGASIATPTMFGNATLNVFSTGQVPAA